MKILTQAFFLTLFHFVLVLEAEAAVSSPLHAAASLLQFWHF